MLNTSIRVSNLTPSWNHFEQQIKIMLFPTTNHFEQQIKIVFSFQRLNTIDTVDIKSTSFQLSMILSPCDEKLWQTINPMLLGIECPL